MNKILIGLGVLLGTFGLGYLVATRMLFPPLPEPEDGIIVPNLSGVVVAEADRQLRPLGLQRGDMIEVAHPSQPPGIIVAQSPLPGQQLRSGGVVRVAISGGLPKVQVPNVIGFDVERATNVLSQLGLSAEKRTEQNDRPAGTVIRVSPEPGMSQPVPARVVLFVSSGPPPAPPDSVREQQPAPTPPAPPPADTTAPPDTLALKAGNY